MSNDYINVNRYPSQTHHTSANLRQTHHINKVQQSSNVAQHITHLNHVAHN